MASESHHQKCCRFFLSAFIHAGFLHVAMNMLAFVPIAASMERQLGTLPMAVLLQNFMLLGNAVHLLSTMFVEYATTMLHHTDQLERRKIMLLGSRWLASWTLYFTYMDQQLWHLSMIVFCTYTSGLHQNWKHVKGKICLARALFKTN